jgi:hypothetical protein
LALVLPPDLGTLDRLAPQFTELVSVTWNSESQRVSYSVDRESWSEPANALGNADRHRFRVMVERGGRVAFFADDRLRWRSTLPVPLGTAELKAQLWLGGRATGEWGAISDVRVTLEEGAR